GEVSRNMFADLWPGVPEAEPPVGSITNGVHGATWVSAEMSDLLSTTVGDDWQWADDEAWTGVVDADNVALWAAHQSAKARMIDHVRDRLRNYGLAQGRSVSDLEWVDRALDPDALTFCFARRMATYKRAALLLSQPDRLRALILQADRPVQFIFAGKAHPADDDGKELIRKIATFAHQADVRHRFVFVEDYDMALARSLVQGADVWLNTPVRPMEASGTSGMKAVLNGALHCSVLDGWWAECFSAGDGGDDEITTAGPNGWAISSAEAIADEARRTEIEANGLFDLLETQVVPLYWERSGALTPVHWVARMKASLRTLGPFVSAHRMVRDYVEELYLPAASRNLELCADGFSGARDLAAYRGRVEHAWHQVHVDDVHVNEDVGDLGAERTVTAVVALGHLEPHDVAVQLVVGHVGQSGELEGAVAIAMQVDESTEGLADGHRRYSGTAALAEAGRMGVTVRVVPTHRLVAAPVEFGRVAWAG
ncbi:MAG: alpha-glucan family phosphorylase, partial [Actinomycetes bacterium]